MIQKALLSLRKRGIVGMLQAGVSGILHNAGKRFALLRDYCSTHRFIRKSSGKSKLIVILAGYKPYLWPATLVRPEKYAPRMGGHISGRPHSD